MKTIVKKFISIKYLLLLALLLRLFFIYFQYSGDTGNHLVWGRGALEGLFGFYNKSFSGFNSPNYPPLTILLFSLSAWFYQFMQSLVISINQVIPLFPSKIVPLMETLNMQVAFVKLPAILADLGIGWLIYKLAPVKNKSHRLIASSLYLLNPAVIYISTIWGQIESIPIFLILLSLYFFNKRQFVTSSGPQQSVGWLRTFSSLPAFGWGLQLKNYYLSHISFSLAILSKQTALWLLPVFLILWLKNRPLKTLLQGLTLQVIIFIMLYLPFTHSLIQPFTFYWQTLAGSSSLVSDAAWNIWYFFYPVSTPDSIILLGLSVRIWSILSLAISIGCIIYQFAKQKLNLYPSLFFISLVAFFLQTRVHERHLFPALVFLLLVNFKNKNYLYLSFTCLSLFHLFNLYWSLGLPFI